MYNGQRLLDYVDGLTPAKVNDDGTLAGLLTDCWDEIGGSDAESTTAEKLRRIEELEWHPPEISFVIERHGGMGMGSARADLHRWSVDVDMKRAGCDPSAHRQLKPMDKPFRAKEAAEEIIAAMEEGQDDPRLKWLKGRIEVRVTLSKSIPDSGSKQTAQGRAKRLREELIRLAPAHGWKRVGNQGACFERPAPCVEPPDTPDH